MTYQISARKWRPQTFEEVVGQEQIARTLQNALSANRIAHAYLFCGMRGVGKTTMARIFAKALNCLNEPTKGPCNNCDMCHDITKGSSPDVIEIDGASNTSVDDVRELRQNVRYAPARGKYKVYIVDEVHMLSKSAFNAFLKTLEEPPPHTVFIFATTEPHKIPETIHSRCQTFVFKGCSKVDIAAQLNKIAKEDGITFEGQGIDIIANGAGGSMRDALVFFDQVVSYAGKNVSEEKVREVLGVAGMARISAIIDSVITGDVKGIVSHVREVEQEGVDLKNLSQDILHYLRNMTICKLTSEPGDLIGLDADLIESIKGQASGLDETAIQFMFQIMLKTDFDMKPSTLPTLVLEMGLIKMTQAASMVGIASIIEKMESVSGGDNGGGSVGAAVPVPKREAKPAAIKEDRGAKKSVAPPLDNLPMTSNQITNEGESVWLRVQEGVSNIRPRLGGVLEHAIFHSLTADSLVIGFANDKEVAFYRGEIDSNMEIIDKVLSEVLGRKVTLAFKDVAPPKTKKKNAPQGESDNWKKEIVGEVLNHFPGVVASDS
ncbi:MAG: DNA polymerase III subunit gamma/tau [Nitrospinota bacterium]